MVCVLSFFLSFFLAFFRSFVLSSIFLFWFNKVFFFLNWIQASSPATGPSLTFLFLVAVRCPTARVVLGSQYCGLEIRQWFQTLYSVLFQAFFVRDCSFVLWLCQGGCCGIPCEPTVLIATTQGIRRDLQGFHLFTWHSRLPVILNAEKSRLGLLSVSAFRAVGLR